MKKKVSIIGGGRIGKFIIRRLLKTYPDIQIVVSTKTQESASSLMKLFPVKATTDNRSVINFSDIIFLCIRPDNLKEFLHQIKDVSLTNKTFISLLVIFEPTELERKLEAGKVCTFHPTTYLHYSERKFLKSFIVFSKNFTKLEKNKLKTFLSKPFGNIEEEKSLITLKEKVFLYGNFPAYLVDIIGRLTNFLSERLNISEEEAKTLLRDALRLSSKDIETIKDNIATPDGITQRGLKTIEKVIEELTYLLEANTFFKIDIGRKRYGNL